MTLDESRLIVFPPQPPEGLEQLRDGCELTDPGQVLLQGARKPLSDPIAFGLPDEAQRTSENQEAQILLEVVGHGSTAVVVADGRPFGDPSLEAAKVFADALTDRLQRHE